MDYVSKDDENIIFTLCQVMKEFLLVKISAKIEFLWLKSISILELLSSY